MGQAGVVTLTRPAALNALTHRMVKALTAALHAWQADSSVALVVIKAEGRAFCGRRRHTGRLSRASAAARRSCSSSPTSTG